MSGLSEVSSPVDTQETDPRREATRLLRALKPRHRAFVKAFCGEAHHNATDALRAIGTEAPPGRVHINAGRLRWHPGIAAAIVAVDAMVLRGLTEGMIHDNLARAAGGDITDLLDEHGEFDLKAAREKRILKKLKIKRRADEHGVSTEHEFEIHDPIAATMHAAKIMGIAGAEKVEHGLSGEAQTALERAIAGAQAKRKERAGK